MSEFEDVVLQFKSAGLFVSGNPEHLRMTVSLHPPEEVPFFDTGSIIRIVRGSVRLRWEKNQWYIARREYIPGPRDEEFEVFQSFEDGIKTVIEYFKGQPTLINKWVVPLHRHPELSEEDVRHAITQNVIYLTQVQFEQVKKGAFRAELKLNRREFPDVLPFRFIEILHETDENRRLYLRRDGEVAYVVKC
jgi:hypothetical protein